MTKYGFTLIELIIIITIISILSLSGISYYQRSISNFALSTSSHRLIDDLENAHLFSQSNKSGYAWGIQNSSASSYMLFSKDDAGNIIIDKQKKLDPPVTFSGNFSIVFEKHTGYLVTPMAIQLISNGIPSTTIHINEFGNIRSTFP